VLFRAGRNRVDARRAEVADDGGIAENDAPSLVPLSMTTIRQFPQIVLC
jgi:hypothetical protein